MKEKTSSPENRRKAASCLWAYHDARHAKWDCARVGNHRGALEAYETCSDAYRQYQHYKFLK